MIKRVRGEAIMTGVAPKLLEVPESVAITTKPKVVDFTEVDIYPSKYKYVNGRVSIRSIMIENIEQQHEIFKKMNTTVYIGDKIKIDIKFGHLVDGEWIDLYYKGILRVKKILPRQATCEILMLVSEVERL